MKKTNYIWIMGIIALIVIALFMLTGTNGKEYPNLNSFNGTITIYKSSTCGCCSVYGNYFEKKGNSNIEVVNTEQLNLVKTRYGVPLELSSCHTTIVGDYFIEGHIPLEAVDRLLSERPNISGIAMPDMPSGSPGMPGRKTGDFVIYAVNNDGSYEEYMRL